jgi:pilus assembly protein CpaC
MKFKSRMAILVAAFAALWLLPTEAGSADMAKTPIAVKNKAASVQNYGNSTRVIGASQAREIKIGINRSIILELPGDAKDILVSNPAIADVIVRSQRRVFLTGKGVGSTNIFFFDEASQQIASIDLVVERDLEGLNRTLARVFRGSDVHAEGVGQNVILSGSVNSDADAQTAVDVAKKFLEQSGSSSPSTVTSATSSTPAASAGSTSGGGTNVVNALRILGKSQVQLRVVIAEVNRDAMKQIGVDLNGKQYGLSDTNGSAQAPETMVDPKTGEVLQSWGPQGNGFSSGGGTPDLASLASAGGAIAAFAIPATHQFGKLAASATVHALEKTGLSKILAEPTLTAISGEEANFLAGGQIPIVTGFDKTSGTPSITFKDFGVGLAFNPIVLSEGRISVRVKTEVSELNNNLGIPMPGGGTMPGIDVRRAETVLELPSGGSMMIAGLLRDTTKMSVKGIPALRKLPILGRLFSSQEFLTNQTELVVIVTPYIVNPVGRKELALPTDGFVNASDPEQVLWGRFNKVYGVDGKGAPNAPYHGRIGFIYE